MAFPQFEVLNTVTEMDIATTISGTTARNGIHLAITDSSTVASGRNLGIYVEYVITGAKTGGECNPFSARVTASDSASDVYAYHALFNITSGKNFSNVGLFYGYMSDIGSGTIANAWAIKADRVTTTQASTRDAFIILKAHGGAGSAKTVFYIEGTSNKMAEQFLMLAGCQSSTSLYVEGINVGSSYTCAAALRVGVEAIIGGGVTTQYYLPLYTAD